MPLFPEAFVRFVTGDFFCGALHPADTSMLPHIKPGNIGLDVQHGGLVQHIEPTDMQEPSLTTKELYGRKTDRVRA